MINKNILINDQNFKLLDRENINEKNELFKQVISLLKKLSKIVKKSKFVLSPPGNGIDCHRTWEALCLGAIPIVRAKQFKSLFADLPVLNVDEWSDVTPELLQNTLREFKQRNFNYEKLTLKYWTDQFV